jgi:hypothetical protein
MISMGRWLAWIFVGEPSNEGSRYAGQRSANRREVMGDSRILSPAAETGEQSLGVSGQTSAPIRGEAAAATILDEALRVMSDFHATFTPAHDADLTPQTTPAAFRAFVDALANLHYRRHRL